MKTFYLPTFYFKACIRLQRGLTIQLAKSKQITDGFVINAYQESINVVC